MYCFYLFLVLLVSGHYRLDDSFFREDSRLQGQDPEQQQAGSKESDP
jgi:hypothetical protein